ncbi:hypothetical protein [Actinoallomurus sp. NPDC050550]|uniref:hypothetical protein n=1 Tax=Actinoallomurus sp. NPDC050550 TaxID=3154937 RepID=UPI0033CE5C86
MRFAAFARQVRDPSLPYARRESAYRECVALCHPIGWHETTSFLEEKAGSFGGDDGPLLRALDLLEASRDVWMAELRGYEQQRRREKREGRRTPSSRPPSVPMYWYGAPLEGELYALRYWRRRHNRTLGDLGVPPVGWRPR